MVGDGMTWGEALRLTALLSRDPSSQIAAAVSEWDFPASRSDLALWDLYDLTHHIAWATNGRKGSKPNPYPRPMADPSKQRTRIGDANLPLSELRATLDAHRAAVDREG